MENEIKSKSVWQKPEIIDLDIDTTSKTPTAKEDGPTLGPSPS